MEKETNQSTLSLHQQALECPVDGVKVNENKVRTVAFGVLLTTIAYLLTGFWPLFLFLLIDFALRAFNFGQYSLLARLSDGVIKLLKFPVVPIDQAPKRFAAGVGMVFSVVILGLHGLGISAFWVAGVIAVFAALESLAGFCAGCYVYTLLKKIRVIS
ncbi:DUF4395 domain-containing protein [Spirosoma sp. BT702]|uniref:DUF4395 domain-containing protein n=1 Tax=Spirosoma profusum TaxID=2771354 RepID=A0A927AQ91_9BACT|nr:DUF4395 domain-containing protein [Spirosoma profusum]MBD2699866.1 DUF4395 domain-containing protein [Spirosoma profusum]